MLGGGHRNGRLLGHTHLRGEGAVWHPFSTSHWSGLLQHSVDLLQGKTLGLRDEEVCVEEAHDAERSPEEENLWSEVDAAASCGSDVWGNNCDDAIPQPVGRGGKGNTAGSDWQREDFTNDNPGSWSPSGGEEEDVDADERDHGGNGWLTGVGNTNDANNKLANNHTESTPDHDRSSAKLLDNEEGDWGRAHINQGGDQTDQERVVDSVELGEEGGSEIENEVDTGPLLHHLHASA